MLLDTRWHVRCRRWEMHESNHKARTGASEQDRYQRFSALVFAADPNGPVPCPCVYVLDQSCIPENNVTGGIWSTTTAANAKSIVLAPGFSSIPQTLSTFGCTHQPLRRCCLAEGVLRHLGAPQQRAMHRRLRSQAHEGSSEHTRQARLAPVLRVHHRVLSLVLSF